MEEFYKVELCRRFSFLGFEIMRTSWLHVLISFIFIYVHYLLFLLFIVIVFLSKQRVSDVSLLTSRVLVVSFHGYNWMRVLFLWITIILLKEKGKTLAHKKYTWMRMLTSISYWLFAWSLVFYGLCRKLFINLLASQFRFLAQVEL